MSKFLGQDPSPSGLCVLRMVRAAVPCAREHAGSWGGNSKIPISSLQGFPWCWLSYVSLISPPASQHSCQQPECVTYRIYVLAEIYELDRAPKAASSSIALNEMRLFLCIYTPL